MPRLECSVLFLAFAAAACGTDSYTPACPEIPRFDIREPGERDDPEVLRARAAAVEAGCLTPPGNPAPVESGGRGGEAGLGAGTAGGSGGPSNAGDGGAAS
jgi:hypothetical protein